MSKTFTNDAYCLEYNEGIIRIRKCSRKEINLTQKEFADRAGVALTVVRKIKQEETNINMRKVNLVLLMFLHSLKPMKLYREEKLQLIKD